MPHTDGPAYYPITCAVSLGATEWIKFTPRRGREGSDSDRGRFVAKLEHGSLFVFEGDAYRGWEHAIPPSDANEIFDRDEVESYSCGVEGEDGVESIDGSVFYTCRISLTVRHKYDLGSP